MGDSQTIRANFGPKDFQNQAHFARILGFNSATRLFIPCCSWLVERALWKNLKINQIARLLNYTQYNCTALRGSFSQIFMRDHSLKFDSRCLYNCHPADPTEKMIWVVNTNPYKRGSVNWTVKIDNKEQDVKMREEVNSFHPLTATRILRISPNAFSLENVQSIASFRASRMQFCIFVHTRKSKLHNFDFGS